ncbi:MAG: HAD family hydrolase [Treponema sp.]|jgi:phosphoglycolate phosphatase|nr:HAD family hydrolase [Treponema sp.]
MKAQFRCVIFDLDGTLVDTIDDIAGAMNSSLAAHAFPTLSPEDFTEKVGWGIRKLAYLALPAACRDDKTVEAVSSEAIRIYTKQPVVHSRPYPGIPELTAELKRRKIKTAVLTNKPDPVARLVVDSIFPPGSFDLIYGDLPGRPRKPDPAAAWEMLMKLDATPRETIFVGDSEVDIETARAASCHALGVSWGFRDREMLRRAGADRIIDNPEELLTFIDLPI